MSCSFLLKIYIHIFTIHLHSTEIYIKGNNKTWRRDVTTSLDTIEDTL